MEELNKLIFFSSFFFLLSSFNTNRQTDKQTNHRRKQENKKTHAICIYQQTQTWDGSDSRVVVHVHFPVFSHENRNQNRNKNRNQRTLCIFVDAFVVAFVVAFVDVPSKHASHETARLNPLAVLAQCMDALVAIWMMTHNEETQANINMNDYESSSCD